MTPIVSVLITVVAGLVCAFSVYSWRQYHTERWECGSWIFDCERIAIINTVACTGILFFLAFEWLTR